MVKIWQAHVGFPQAKGWLGSHLQDLGLSPAPPKPLADPTAMSRIFQHRGALVRLGYLTERRFQLSPIKVGSQEYNEFCARVAAETGQQPTAQLIYDIPTMPREVLGLTVYAPKNETPRWREFVADLTKHHE